MRNFTSCPIIYNTIPCESNLSASYRLFGKQRRRDLGGIESINEYALGRTRRWLNALVRVSHLKRSSLPKPRKPHVLYRVCPYPYWWYSFPFRRRHYKTMPSHHWCSDSLSLSSLNLAISANIGSLTQLSQIPNSSKQQKGVAMDQVKAELVPAGDLRLILFQGQEIR